MQTEQAAPPQSAPATPPSPLRDQLRARYERLRLWSETPQGAIWRDAAWIWLLTRVLFLLLTPLVPALLRPTGSSGLSTLIARWGQQDAGHFAFIAANGYYPIWRTAFWPLFPGLEHILGPVTGGDYVIAGLLIANVAFFGALVALRRLAERELGAEVARRTILYISIFPTAFYFFAPYSESLFLFLSLCSFAAMRERRWWLAGVLGLVATLTRSAGALLLVPFAIEFLLALRARKAHWWEGAWALLIPAAAGLYSAYLALNYGDPLAYLHSQAYWGRTLQWPWVTYVEGIQGVFGGAGDSSAFGATHLLLNFAALLLFVALAVAALRLLPLSYGLYVVAMVVYLSLFPASNNPVAAVQGEARLVLMAFPAFMVLGIWGRTRRVHELFLFLMLPLLTLATAHYLLGFAIS